MTDENRTTNDVFDLDYDTDTEGPSKPGASDPERASKDPRSPGFDKHLDGPVSPRT